MVADAIIVIIVFHINKMEVKAVFFSWVFDAEATFLTSWYIFFGVNEDLYESCLRID